MPVFTTNYNWPTPAATDADNVPSDMLALASAIDTTLATFPQPGASYSSSQLLLASAASVTFPGIPSTMKRLTVTWTARSDNAVTSQQFLARVNSDTGNNYRWAASQNNNGSFAGGVGNGVAFMALGVMAGNSASAGIFASGAITFEGWDSPHAGFLGCTAQSQLLIDGTTYNVYSASGQYSPAGPYTSITLLPQAGNFLTGCEFFVTGQ